LTSINYIGTGAGTPYTFPNPQPTQTINIQNDDAELEFTGGTTIIEKTTGSQMVSLTITSKQEVIGGFTVSFTDSSVLGQSVDTYSISVSTLTPIAFSGTLLALPESHTIDVIIPGDYKIETDDIITVTLTNIHTISNNQDFSISMAQQITVQNDDPTLSISLGGATPTLKSVIERSSGPQPLSATVLSDIPIPVKFFVAFSVSYPTGDDGSDYTFTTISLPEFNGGDDESYNILFDIIGDIDVELDESLTITLDSVTYENGDTYNLSGLSAQVLIPNDDTTFVITGAPAGPVPELSSPQTTPITLTVTSKEPVPPFELSFTLTGVASRTVIPIDYNCDPSPLVFGGGDEEFSDVLFTIIGDALVELPDEDIIFTLTRVTYTNPGSDYYDILGGPSATIIIQNDDTVLGINLPVSQFLERDSSSLDYNFVVSSTQNTHSGFTVNFVTTTSTASSVGDYSLSSPSSVHFPGAATSETVDLIATVLGDPLVELDETIVVTLVSMDYDFPRTDTIDLTSLNLKATFTIKNDDSSIVSISPGTLTIDEGTPPAAGAVFTFTVSSTKPTEEGFDVVFAVSAGSLADPLEYSITSSPIHFNGATSESSTIVVTAVPDYQVEVDETVIIDLISITSPMGLDIQVSGTNFEAIATIRNDDEAHASINSPAIDETDMGDTSIVFRLSVDYVDPLNPCDFTYAITDDTATSPSDYENPLTGFGTLPKGASYIDIPFTVHGDETVEYDESFNFQLITFSCGPIGSIASGLGVGTIRNDDLATISVYCSPCFGDEDTAGNAHFHIHSTKPIDLPHVSVDITVASGTAVALSDFKPFSTTTVTFTDVDTDFPLDCQIFSDPLFENDEDFTVTISNLRTLGTPNLNVVMGQNVATYTIKNDDQAQIVLTPPSPTNEGNTGVTPVVFSFWFNAASGQPVELDWQIDDLSATVADGDYIDTSGTIVFAGVLPSETKTVVVNIRGDYKGEPQEDFRLSAAALRQGTLTYPISLTNFPGTASIVNDDTVKVSISDAENFEGTTTPNTLVFTISADYQSSVPYTVQATVNSGSAIQGVDFISPPSQNFNFVGSAGESYTFSITTIADPDAEINEDFTVTLTMVTTGYNFLQIGDGSGKGTIKNDDSISVTVDDCSVPEGGACVFNIKISEDITPPIDIYYLTNNLGTAKAPSDFTAVSSQVSLGGGVLTVPVSVSTQPDFTGELDEYFYFKIGDIGLTLSVQDRALPASVIIADNQAVGTILNIDDFIIALAIKTNQVQTEGAFPSTYDVEFEIQITGALDTDIDVDFLISGGTATGGSDFNDPGTIPVHIPQGALGPIDITPAITVLGDDVVEDLAGETFIGILQNIQSKGRTVIVSQASATATINEDDTATFTVADISNRYEGSSGLVFFQFDFILQQDVDVPFSFDYTTKDGSATILDDDYNGASGTLAFAGVKNEARHVFVQINTDTKVEDNEDFTFVLSNPNFSNRQYTLPAAPKGTLRNDDSSLISVVDSSIAEGDSGTNAFMINVISSNSVDVPFTVDYSISPGTAFLTEDYVPPISGTLNFGGGVAGEVQPVTVSVVGDTRVEPTNEVFYVKLGAVATPSAPLGRDIVASSTDGVGTIIDNDSAVVNIADATASEATGNIDFIVSLSAGVTLPADLTLTWTLTHVTTKASDFTSVASPITGTVTISQGTPSGTISIGLKNDAIVEPTETFHVTLTPPAVTRVTLGTATALGTINDDDSAMLTFDYATIPGSSVAENGSGSAIFEVSLSAEVEIPVTFSFTTVDDTAFVSDADYQYNAGSYSVTLATSPVLITVPITPDTKLEPNEKFDMDISNIQVYGQNVALPGVTSLPFTITNDDSSAITINAVTTSRNEGNSGTTNFLWAVHLDFATSVPIEVDYSTKDGSATTADSDYVPKTGTLVFSGTSTNEILPIIVGVNGDLVGEISEQFSVHITAIRDGGLGVTYDSGDKSVTIVNDDTIQVSITDSTIVEGNAGNSLMQFTLSVSGGVANGFTLDVIAAGSGGNPATIGTDFVFSNPSSYIVLPGNSPTSFIVSVNVAGDTTVEADEEFTLTVSVNAGSTKPGYVTLTDPTAIGTIQNDDGVSVSISDCSGTEGGTCDVTVSLTADVAQAFTLTLSTLTNTAIAGTDFTDQTPLPVNLGAGTTSVTIKIPLTNDALNELTESFTMTLTGSLPSGVSAARLTGTGTIIDNDPVTLNLVQPATFGEGDSGVSPMAFTITVSRATDVDVTFDFTTMDLTAKAGSDYNTVTRTITISATINTDVIVPVPIIGDFTVEAATESFLAQISNVQSAGRPVTIGTSAVQAVIQDNDKANLNVIDCSAFEGNNGVTFVQMGVSLDALVDTQFTVTWSTQDSSATVADSDYVGATGVLTIAGAPGNYYLTLSYNGDLKVEPLESFLVLLGTLTTNGRNVMIQDGTGKADIKNDDGTTLSIGDVTHFEGSSSGLTTQYSFPVTSTGAIPGVSISWTVNLPSSTATSVEDFIQTSGSIVFSSSTAPETQYINIDVNHDTKVEAIEIIQVDLVNPSLPNVVIGDGTALGRIVNDDFASFSIADLSKLEGATPFLVPITLNANVDAGPGGIDILVTFSDITTTSNILLPDPDYDITVMSNPTTINFSGNAGEFHTFSIPVDSDNIVELDEYMSVSISIASNPYPFFLGISDDTAQVVIRNDDTCTVSIVPNAPSVSEGDVVPVPYAFTVTLTNPIDVAVTIDITASDITATQYLDYSDPSPNQIVTSAMGTTTVTVPILPDLNVELNESFQLALSLSDTQGRSVVIGGTPAIGVIDDNDEAEINFTFIASQPETDSNLSVVIQATLSAAVDGTVRFDYVTSDVTAQLADSDYASAAGSVVFAGTAGEVKTITIIVYGDTKVESNESFRFTASNLQSSGRPVSWGASGSQFDLTITNDDQSVVSIHQPVVHLEGTGANTDFVFVIENSNAVDVGFTVDYTTSPGTASAGSDYISTPLNSKAAFSGFAGETKSITVVVNGDFLVEANEVFDFIISNIKINGGILVRNVVLDAVTSRIGSIINDDSALISVSDQIGNEGTGLVFTVTMSNQVDEDVYIDYQVDDITTIGADWAYFDTIPLKMGAGSTSATITITAKFDGIDEPTETFTLRLNSITAAGGRSVSFADAYGTGTILDQNSASISIDDVSPALELSGTGATHDVIFTVTLNGDVSGGFVVSYETDDLLAHAGSDYLPESGFLSFAGFDTESKNITIKILEDSIVELDETFRVVLSDVSANVPPRDILISKAIGICTLNNDDFTLLSISDSSHNEGNSGTTPFDFAVSSTKAVDVSFVVPWAITSATNNGDVFITSGQVTFAGAAAEVQNIRALVYGDVLVEAYEYFYVNIGPAAAISAGGRDVRIGDGQGEGEIKNDDTAVVSVSDATAWEVDGFIYFSVSVTNAVDGGFTVNAVTHDGTAVNLVDFTAINLFATFTGNAGETRIISIPLINSAACEATKTFTLQLTSISAPIAGSSVVINSDDTALGTIRDDDVGNPVNDLYFGASGATLNVAAINGVLANDPCTAGTVHLVTNTHLGTLVLNGDGSFRYDTTDCYDDVDFFTYRITFANGQVSSTAKVTLVTSPCRNNYGVLYVYTPISWDPDDVLGETTLIFTARDNNLKVMESKTLDTTDLARGYYLYRPWGSVPGTDQTFTIQKGSNMSPVPASPNKLTMILANSGTALSNCC